MRDREADKEIRKVETERKLNTTPSYASLVTPYLLSCLWQDQGAGQNCVFTDCKLLFSLARDDVFRKTSVQKSFLRVYSTYTVWWLRKVLSHDEKLDWMLI